MVLVSLPLSWNRAELSKITPGRIVVVEAAGRIEGVLSGLLPMLIAEGPLAVGSRAAPPDWQLAPFCIDPSVPWTWVTAASLPLVGPGVSLAPANRVPGIGSGPCRVPCRRGCQRTVGDMVSELLRLCARG
jgi:hypothetical protein